MLGEDGGQDLRKASGAAGQPLFGRALGAASSLRSTSLRPSAYEATEGDILRLHPWVAGLPPAGAQNLAASAGHGPRVGGGPAPTLSPSPSLVGHAERHHPHADRLGDDCRPIGGARSG